MQLDVALKLISTVRDYLVDYREHGFASAKVSARELAEEVETDPVFTPAAAKRRAKVRRLFDYEAVDEPLTDPEEAFKVNYFNVLLDQALSSVDERFVQLQVHTENFGFLYKISEIATLEQSAVMENCKKLEAVLDGPSGSDINATDLSTELQTLSKIIPGHCTAFEALKFIHQKKLAEVYPNVSIVLRILLTIPVTVASAERSFSKLKLILTYLRSSMSQERLNGLAMMSIEKDLLSRLDYSEIIDTFASIKARKVQL